jgi:hypothetical protein
MGASVTLSQECQSKRVELHLRVVRAFRLLTESISMPESVRRRVATPYSPTSESKHNCDLPDAETARYSGFGISYALR